MTASTRWMLVYAAMAGVVLVLDALWLGVVARPWYQAGIGHLLAEPPRWSAALLFYALYPLGLLVLGLLPLAATATLSRVLLQGALLGLFAYGTYDLSNLATLRGWPVWLALLDMAWGTLISALTVGVGKLVLDRLGPG